MLYNLISDRPDVEILEQVDCYLSGKMGLGELEEWVASRLFWLLSAPRSTGTQLAGVVELALAEMSLGHRTEEEVRRMIAEFVASHRTALVFPNVGNPFGTTSENITRSLGCFGLAPEPAQQSTSRIQCEVVLS